MAFARWVENFMLSNPTFLGITAVSWLTFAGVWLAAFIVLRWTRHIVFKRLHALAARTATSLDDLGEGLVRRTSTTFLLLLALYFGISTLPLASDKQSIVSMAMLVVVLVQSGLWAHEVVDYAIRELVRRDSDLDSGLRTAAGAIGFAGRVLVWSVILILILSNLHVNVTTLIAGLGVGGVAIALAVQNVLGDLFASLSILVDQPFVVGHFIVIDDLAGTVEHVGLKTTRIRSLSGEQVVMSNADLLKSRIHNYKRLYERRVLFGFGVTYNTGYEKLVAIPPMVRQIVTDIPGTRFDRAHFKEFGDSSLNFEVVYFVLDPDYNRYMDVQQRINLELYRRFEERGIEFAFPTRTLYVSPVGEAHESDGRHATAELHQS
jgi:small-conductance mechanosensitive channel